MYNIKNLMDKIEIESDDLILQLRDYDNGYISDLINEIADNNVSIYTNDLWTWARDNSDKVEDAISEFGWDSKNGTLEGLFQLAMYSDNENIIYNDLQNAIRYTIYDYISDMETISESLYDYIEDIVEDVDNNDMLNIILETIDEFIEEAGTDE